MYLSQLIGGDANPISIVMWIVFMAVFFMFYPRMMLYQMMWKLEGSAKKLERMSSQSKSFLLKEMSKKPNRSVKESVDRFFEFFMIEPVGMDPYGIVKKFDHLIKGEHDRFKYFVNQVVPGFGEERQANIRMGLAGGIQLYMISKIVRHFVELIKKTKSFQIGMLIQMQMPLIERIAKALFVGTKSLARGEPVGDGIGPWVIANMTGKARTSEIVEGIIVAESKVEGRQTFLLRAKGPGGRVGFPGKGVEMLLKRHKIARIITIDAAAKLEGEETGSIAEGVGVAMGGPGVERSYIENAIVKQDIPVDSIVIKMSAEEAISPMRKSMIKAYPLVQQAVARSMSRTKKGDKVIIAGIGNASGVGNTKAEADQTVKWVDKYERRLMAAKKKKD